MSDGGSPWPAYSYLEKAAEEARRASRRYWAKGGYADRRFPPQPMPWWPQAPEAGGMRKQERRQWITKG